LSECERGLQRIAFATTPPRGEESRAIEAGTAIERHGAPLGRRVGDILARDPRLTALGVLLLIFLVLVAAKGLHDVAQTGLNGLSLGAIYALGAVGLTLVYGILRLVNFAHGDFLTFGAYMAYLVNVTWGAPLVVAIFWAMLMTAVLGILLDRVLWAPMRTKGAGMLQFLLMAIGLAFLLRAVVQWFWGTQVRTLDVNVTSSVEILGLRIGQTELIVVIVGLVVLLGIGIGLRMTLLGKRMRALSDDLELAETAGIDTRRVILWTWVFAGGLAGLAGVLAGSITALTPEMGFELLLPIFAAVVLGGIGDAFGALAAGMVIGVMTEWSTLLIDARWKTAIGFLVLLLVLIVRPQGIFGRAKAI
jgi:neutral amino acid transport system permease protein